MINIKEFINTNVTKRCQSMFLKDIIKNEDILKNKIIGKKILVIGGAGSIGSSFIKAVLPYEPASLVIVDFNENGLAEITRDLRSTYDLYMPEEYITYPMDYASNVFEKMFRFYKGFDIIANFSAHKHVRSEKDIFSIETLLRNNVLNAKGLMNLLMEFPPEEFFCVSTDKAANPVNLMGASKRIMEDLIFSYSDIFKVNTARFANVAFSNGSLPAGFIERIAKRQPLAAPLDVRRYFVSIEESGQICMLSSMLGKNREIFFPKFEQSQMMSFDEIAISLLKEYGFIPIEYKTEEEAKKVLKDMQRNGKEYPVFFSESDTTGEKMTEEFYTEREEVDLDRFYSLGVIKNKEAPNKNRLEDFLNELEILLDSGFATKKDIIHLVSGYVPNFLHFEKNRFLDEKM